MKLGVVMDPISGINVKKDSSFAMLLAAQRRGWPVQYMELNDLFVRDGTPMARMRALSVDDRPNDWFRFHGEQISPLSGLDVILMRKDPPVDTEYIYSTHLLELAMRQGALIVNDPVSLRDVNEKLFITHFPQCIPPTLVTRSAAQIRDFVNEHGDVVLKPLHGMGGMFIFRLNRKDPNVAVITESLTEFESRFVMAQRFLPEIEQGDKRILLIDGEPVGYALARIPKAGDFRGNLAAGGRGVGVELSDRDRWICAQLAPVVRDKGLLFVGLDVIGDYLTEINVTSPTCIRELDAAFELDIAGQLLDVVAARRGS
ncbi:MAG: glutathione synthase [Gammaproteobacteria bacterium]|nr:glutathione synthase [Gammaproteobacteria bacterium]